MIARQSYQGAPRFKLKYSFLLKLCAGGVEEKVKIKSVSGQEGVYECVYTPTKPGNYIINVTFADQHISKSPFKVGLIHFSFATGC